MAWSDFTITCPIAADLVPSDMASMALHSPVKPYLVTTSPSHDSLISGITFPTHEPLGKIIQNHDGDITVMAEASQSLKDPYRSRDRMASIQQLKTKREKSSVACLWSTHGGD